MPEPTLVSAATSAVPGVDTLRSLMLTWSVAVGVAEGGEIINCPSPVYENYVLNNRTAVSGTVIRYDLPDDLVAGVAGITISLGVDVVLADVGGLGNAVITDHPVSNPAPPPITHLDIREDRQRERRRYL